MLGLSLLLLLSAAPTASAGSATAAVVVSRRTGVSAEQAQALARELAAALGRRLSVPLSPEAAHRKLSALKRDPTTCAGRLSCLAELGKLLGVDVVVGLSVSQIETDRSVYFEAVASGDSQRLAKHAFMMPATGAMPAKGVGDFVAEVAAVAKASEASARGSGAALPGRKAAGASEIPARGPAPVPAAPLVAPVDLARPASAPGSSLGLRQLAWAPAAAGLAFAGGGTLLTLRSKGRADAIAGRASGLMPPLTVAQVEASTGAGRSEQTVGVVLVGAGAAALLAAGAMAFFGTEADGVSAGVVIEPQGAAASLGASF